MHAADADAQHFRQLALADFRIFLEKTQNAKTDIFLKFAALTRHYVSKPSKATAPELASCASEKMRNNEFNNTFIVVQF
ncbi:hypothetical protein [Flavimaribacter sediminis]|uniref:hypothetical protein n=1 Tax=Flavimaribacter sediminis TaxID=2865987 RepID=UPI00215D8299|nr:hypothetical protein [Flavimaribacter sediminis]